MVSLYRVMISPLIFVFFTLHTLTQFPLRALSLTGLILALGLGVALGFWQVYQLDLQVDKKQKLLHLPGSWITLVLILIIFGSKFYFGYTIAIDPEIIYTPGFSLAAMVISGLCTGMLLGRVGCYGYRFKQG